MKMFKASVWALAFLFLMGIVSVSELRAQIASTATIQGTVSDTSGAVVPNAQIQVRDTGTGITRTATTDAQGRYTVPTLQIGAYDVQAVASGFQTVTHKGITLTVGNTQVVDFSLPVGQAQQTVTVEGQVTQVQTSDTAISSLVEPTQMTQLPLNGRNFSQLLLLEPGVQSTRQGSTFYGTQGNYSIAGGRPQGQAFLLDGSNISTFWDHGTGSGATGNSLGIDGIAEFQTLTNTYSAQFGGSGAVINATSKSGTNNFHGTAYEFLRNSAVDARNHFDPATIPAFRRNQFGGSLGGPVKKDKAFFFVNYEGLRQSLGTSRLVNAPDANAHNGLIPCYLAPATPCGAGNLANVGVATNIASTLALYPVAATETLSKAGLPTGTGTTTEVASNIANENYLATRFDYTVSEKDSFFMRYIRDTANQTLPFAGSVVPLWPEDDATANHFATIGERHIFSSNFINSAHFEFDRPKDIGHTGASHAATTYFTGRQDGNLSVGGTGATGLLSAIGANALLPFSLPQNRFVFADDILWTHGSHSFAMGVALTRQYTNTLAPFQWGGSWTFPNLQSFLAGTPTQLFSAAAGNVITNKNFRELYLSPYFNDTWMITPKLTVNYGIRWDWETNPIQTDYGMEAFPNPPIGSSPTCIGGGCFAPVTHAFASNFNYKNWEPRIGIAYDPFGDHKTSIRAGFGIFDNVVQPREYVPGYWLDPPFQLAIQINPIYPTPFSSGAIPLAPIQPEGQLYDWHYTPYSIQYNLNVQREILPNTILTIGYVGSQGVHLVQAIDVNPPGTIVNGKASPYINNGTQWPVQKSVGGLPCTTLPPPDGQIVFGCLNKTGLSVNPLQQANPTLGRLSERSPIAHSHYNSLQASVNRRFTNNVQAQVSYTYAKCIDNGSISSGLESFSNGNQLLMNPYNPSQDVGACDFNQTHSFRGSSVVSLPFHGNAFVEGWQLSGILSANSGYPIVVSTGYDISGESFDRPQVTPGSNPRPRTVGNPLQWWAFPSNMTMPAVGELGNLGRNTALGPGFLNFDFALLKDTPVRKISEAFTVEFRAEFYDIINHTNYGPPTSGLFSACGIPTGTVVPGCTPVFPGANGGFAANPVFGQITQTNGDASSGGAERVVQFALKLIF